MKPSRNIKRTIESILDLKTGKDICADHFFNKPTDEIFKLRYTFESQKKNPRYVCYYCKQPIKIRGGRDTKTIMHFAHFKDSDDCPIKTGMNLSKEEIQRLKYNGAKESNLHFDLKNKIAKYLEYNQHNKKEVDNIQIEQVFKHKKIPKSWKKPDIAATFKNKPVVFEIQLSTTFLSVINSRQEFYKENSTFILWVFNNFETEKDKRKFTQSDIYYNNNYNGFEFNNQAIELSIKEKDLVLKCHYQHPFIQDNSIEEKWETAYVKLNDLHFDSKKKSVYYFDYETKRKEKEDELKVLNSPLLIDIRNGDRQGINDLFCIEKYALADRVNEKKKIIDLFKNEIKPIQKINRDDWRLEIIWVTILFKLRHPDLIERFIRNSKLNSIVIDILNLKLDKIIGYAFNNPIQIAHRAIIVRTQYMEKYIKAIKTYKPELLSTKYDKKGKLTKLIKEKRSENPVQETNDNDIFDLIFPDLKD